MGPNHADVVKSVIIVGGGFAGLACALELAKDPTVSVMLIDRHNYQQFQPLLYQVATGRLSPSNAAFSFRESHHEFTGVPAFISWLGIHAALLPVICAKVETIIEWAWAYLKGEHPSQFIDR